jgi:uncharacterized protein YyaL (SSP411 family)
VLGDAPKFPHEAQLLMLIDEQMRRPSNDKLNAITTTLNAMAGVKIVLELGKVST